MTAQTPSQTTPAGASLSNDPHDATTGELVTRLSTQISELVRGELALAKAASVPAWPVPPVCSPCTVSAP